MHFRLILVGRTERGHVTEGFAHYADRIARAATFSTVVVPEAGKGDPAFKSKWEGEKILTALLPGEVFVALDERGKSMTSVAFANQLGKWRDGGRQRVAFVVGGAYGLSEPVRERADLLLSLSPMTFPHQLVRVLFAEQLYRSLSILKGSPYHH